jgi:hypothetical protein
MPRPTRTALDAAAKKLMRAKAELKRLQAEVSAEPVEGPLGSAMG